MQEQRFEFPPEGIVQGIIQLFRELYMEIFAVVVPGLCFFILIVPALIIPAHDALQPALGPYTSRIAGFLGGHLGLVVFGLMVTSYVVGHILVRNDPKWPDVLSIRLRSEDKRSTSCVRGKLSFWGPVSEMEEFPYGALKNYLIHRHFDDLAELIKWEEADFKNNNLEKFSRSKHKINELKLEIKLHHPAMYFEVVRNEAHIRLMSSLWYLCLAIGIASIVGLAIGGYLNYRVLEQGYAFAWGRPALHGEALIYPAATLILAVALIFIISQFFHYQRVREIVYVLKVSTLVDPKIDRKLDPGALAPPSAASGDPTPVPAAAAP